MNPTDHDLLIRLDENMKSLQKSINALIEANTKINDDHEGRIRSLEVENERTIGRQGILGAIIGGAIGLIGNLLGNLPSIHL